MIRVIRVASVLATAFLLGTQALAADGPTFKVDPFWPKPLPNNWIIGQVAGVAVDKNDHVWIIHRPRSLTDDEKGATLNPPRSKCCVPAPPVIEFDADGNVVQAWGGNGAGYEWPGQEHGIRVDYKDNVWLGGNGKQDGQVLKFTRDGKFLLQIGHAGPPKGSQDTTQLGQVADFAIDPEPNEVYLADGYGNHRVIVFDADSGAFKRMWGAYGKPPSDDKLAGYNPDSPQFANPVHCVVLANDGLVYVCDRVNNRVQVFHKDGSFVQQFVYLKDTHGSGSTWDLALWPDRDQDYMIMVDGTNNEMRTIRRSDGTVTATVGRSGRNAGQFHWVHNIAIDSKGDIFTTEVDNGKRIQKWVPTNGAPQR